MRMIINTTESQIITAVESFEQGHKLVRMVRDSGSKIESAFIGEKYDLQQMMI